MDNDPPPSYNSVVKGPSDRAIDQAAGNHPDDKRNQEDSDLGKTETKINNNFDENDNSVRDNCNSNSIGDSISTSGQAEQREEHQRLNGLWIRFKKGLEDLALFFIQVLD